jgi:putative FmdB family regulatory protein
MPIFEYQCRACGHRFDVLQKAADPAPGACPACGAAAPQKCLSAPGFQLRGAGWRKAVRQPAPQAVRRVGHTLDSAPPHSHDGAASGDRRGAAPVPSDHSHPGGPGHGHGHGHEH